MGGGGDGGIDRCRRRRRLQAGQVRLVAAVDGVDRVVDRPVDHRHVQQGDRRRLTGARLWRIGRWDQGVESVQVPIPHRRGSRCRLRHRRRHSPQRQRGSGHKRCGDHGDHTAATRHHESSKLHCFLLFIGCLLLQLGKLGFRVKRLVLSRGHPVVNLLCCGVSSRLARSGSCLRQVRWDGVDGADGSIEQRGP